jgi:hypothetical protein
VELPAGFSERYKKDAAAENDPKKMGNKAELLALFEKNRNAIANWVATLSTDDMAKPAPEKLRGFTPTVGHVAQVIPAHFSMHLGQIQVLRRKLGKPLLF